MQPRYTVNTPFGQFTARGEGDELHMHYDPRLRDIVEAARHSRRGPWTRHNLIALARDVAAMAGESMTCR